jgi:hypothetical protein
MTEKRFIGKALTKTNRPAKATPYPTVWIKLTGPCMKTTEKMTKRISFKIPERLRIKLLAAPIRKTTAMLRQRAAKALLSRMEIPKFSQAT